MSGDPLPGDAAIAVRGLTRRFGSFTAVDHLTFAVAPGEVFGFLGANGAGKTTAIKMLIGLLAPSEGEARVAGHDIGREPDRVRELVVAWGKQYPQFGTIGALNLVKCLNWPSGAAPKDPADLGVDVLLLGVQNDPIAGGVSEPLSAAR